MKTVIYQEIDGFKVVKGFGTPVIDPVETAKVINPLLAESEEVAAANDKRNEIIAERKNANSVLKDARVELSKGNKTKAEALNVQINVHVENASQKERELVPLTKAVDAKRRSLTVENAVYFEPRKGEMIIPDDDADTLAAQLKALLPHKVLLTDGTMSADWRNTIHYVKESDGWSEGAITSLGIEPVKGAILSTDLTAEQRQEIAEQKNKERIKALKPADREAEKTAHLDYLATRAASMRSAEEIKGASAKDALAASQVWYQAEAEKMSALYATT